MAVLKNTAYPYIQAAESYSRFNSNKAIENYLIAIELYEKDNLFCPIICKYYLQVAELYEKEGDEDNSLIAYQTAADNFKNHGKIKHANQCLSKIAEITTKKKILKFNK